MSKDSEKVIYFVGGLVIATVLWGLLYDAKWQSLQYWLNVLTVAGSLGAVGVALFIYWSQIRVAETLRDERNELAFQMMREPVSNLLNQCELFLDIVQADFIVVDEILQRHPDGWVSLDDREILVERIENSVRWSISINEQIERDVDFGLIQSQFEYLLSSRKDVREATHLLFGVLWQFKQIEANFEPLFDVIAGPKEAQLGALRALLYRVDVATPEIKKLNNLISEGVILKSAR